MMATAVGCQSAGGTNTVNVRWVEENSGEINQKRQ